MRYITNRQERLSEYMRERMHESRLSGCDGGDGCEGRGTGAWANPPQLPPSMGVFSMLPTSSVRRKLKRT